ncbi:MAG TPA: acyl-CoA dehydrogenase [Gammaproteobacteria bacterium]|nr:acyl-CoA dehydrogenase [Gammaproteobacteria bacterium]HIM87214.1 acyl-CoA dehydrogenase [Gammaproteobacteria bacterium]HIO33042.1 acyl-CoA dehydrogenase [Gammaproteobacteria bacterium]HIP05544.1 acyl-CoA dehydrogenase [Gammaproteobacteria bacterium]
MDEDTLTFGLTETQREMVMSVRRLAQQRFKDRWRQWQDGTFPWENMRDLAEIGVLSMSVPKAYGGLSMSVLDAALILEEIAKVCYVTAMAVLGEVGTQTRMIAHFAPENIKRDILPRVAAGSAVLSICMTEPDAGTDLGRIRTKVTRDDNELILSGTKTLISRADVAEGFVVFARIGDTPGVGGIGGVYVERDTPGMTVNTAYHTIGGEYLSEVVFDQCRIPSTHLLVDSGGFKDLISAFNIQRCLNASISLGLGEGALEESIRYMRERKAYDQRIGDFQGMRWKVAEMYRDIEASRSLLYRACVSANPFPDPILAALAKMTCNQMSLRVTSEAVQIHGGYGFVEEFLVARQYCCARYGSLGGGTTETLSNLVGRTLVDGLDDADGLLGYHNY